MTEKSRNRCLGLIFVKVEPGDGKIQKVLKLLADDRGKEHHGCVTEIVASMAGPFDVVIVVSTQKCSDVFEFVLKHLRSKHKDYVTDTQTYILWEN